MGRMMEGRWTVNGVVEPALPTTGGETPPAVAERSNHGYPTCRWIGRTARARPGAAPRPRASGRGGRGPGRSRNCWFGPVIRILLAGLAVLAQWGRGPWVCRGPPGSRLVSGSRGGCVAVGPARGRAHPRSGTDRHHLDLPGVDPPRRLADLGERFPNVTIPEVRVGWTIVEVRNLSATEHPFHQHGALRGALHQRDPTVLPSDRGHREHSAVRRCTAAYGASSSGRPDDHCHILPHADGGIRPCCGSPRMRQPQPCSHGPGRTGPVRWGVTGLTSRRRRNHAWPVPTTPAQTTSTPTTAASPVVVVTRHRMHGNAAVQDQMSGKSAGQPSREAALGETLGSKLYEAIADSSSDAELRLQPRRLSPPRPAAGRLPEGTGRRFRPDAAAQFVRALDGEIKRIAGDAVAGELGAVIREFADENPVLIASAAVAAAVAYVLSNQEIGMVDGKVRLGGGHSIIGGVDLGRTMDIAVEQVRVGYRYQAAHKAQLRGRLLQRRWFVQGLRPLRAPVGGQRAGEPVGTPDGAWRPFEDPDGRRLPTDHLGLGACAAGRALGGRRHPGRQITAQKDDRPPCAGAGEYRRLLAWCGGHEGTRETRPGGWKASVAGMPWDGQIRACRRSSSGASEPLSPGREVVPNDDTASVLAAVPIHAAPGVRGNWCRGRIPRG